MSARTTKKNRFKATSLSTSILGGLVITVALAATPAHAVVTPDSAPPATVVDTTNTRPYLVGLAISNEAGNSGGTCSGLLINPRAVLFAAHCVDGLAPGAYDGNTRGNRARVGYTTDPLFGRANVGNYLFGQDFGTQPGSDGRTMINSVFVWYDTRSRFGSQARANEGTFLPADIAIAGFDTPTEILGRDAANGIGLLFSPITGAVAVTIGGYGQAGNGLTGARVSNALQESYFRRLGQNVVSFLGSERDIALGVYGSAVGNGLEPANFVYQDLYWADFDDPNRRPFSASITRSSTNNTFDFDVFPGGAVPGEAITAAGDSGSPLITNAFGRDVSLGVLSQGSRFFFDAVGNPNDNFGFFSNPFSNFGTTAGYNPLFLFWDQIMINNPYKYVGVTAGDGEWTDATRWRQELDPLFFTLSGTTLVNGIPTMPAGGVTDTTTNFGTITPNPANIKPCTLTGTCPATGGTSDPAGVVISQTSAGQINLVETGDNTGAQNGAGPTRLGVGGFIGDEAGSPLLVADASTSGNASVVTNQTSASNPTIAPPNLVSDEATSTLNWNLGRLTANTGALTGVGTSGFIANNVIGTAGLQNSTRWFEVNLRNAGTTFLTGANITIDRLNVRGATSGLNVRAGASLTTLLSSFVDAGMVTIDGTLTSRLLAVAGGMVSGTGTIVARDGLMVSGGIVSPGALGNGIGRLAVTAPTTFSGVGMLGIDVGSATLADFLAVNGRLTLGGTLAVNAAYVPTFGTTWNIASATGGISGAFNSFASNLPGVLRPEAIVSGNDLQVRVTAIPFDTFLAGRATAEQIAVGVALNQVRSVAGTGSAANLFAGIDPLDASSLTRAFDGMKPTNALAVNQNVRLDNAVAATALFDRLSRTRSADRGTMAVRTSGAAALMNTRQSQFGGAALGQMFASADAENGGSTMSIAPQWSMFATATYSYGDGKIQETSTAEPTAWTFTLGADRRVSDQIILGFGGSYQSGDAGLSLVGNKVETKGWSLNGYAALDLSEKTKLDAWIRAGTGTLDTTRIQTLGATTFSSAGEADTSSLAWGTTISHTMGKGSIEWTPMLTAIASKTSIDGYTENTGSAALRVDARDVDSLAFKLGLQAASDWSSGTTKMRPYARLSAVVETIDTPDKVTARFVAGGVNAVPFTITGVERSGSYGEVAAGFTIEGSQKVSFSFEANQTLGRDELEVGSVSVTGRLRF